MITKKQEFQFGNYTSQYYANIYMTKLDKYIKENMKIDFYIRYMDDSVFILESKEKAKIVLEKIREYVEYNLKLELNSKTAYFRQSQGVNFCGFRIWKTHRLLRVQSKKKMKRKLKNFQILYKKDRVDLKYVTACINSWKGHAKFANSYDLINKILGEFVLNKQ